MYLDCLTYPLQLHVSGDAQNAKGANYYRSSPSRGCRASWGAGWAPRAEGRARRRGAGGGRGQRGAGGGCVPDAVRATLHVRALGTCRSSVCPLTFSLRIFHRRGFPACPCLSHRFERPCSGGCQLTSGHLRGNALDRFHFSAANAHLSFLCCV